MTTLSIIAFLAPILYGLSEGGWDLQASLFPRYIPPTVGLEMGKPTIKVDGLSLILSLQATNTGEVRLSILSMNALAYALDGVVLGESRLVQTVTLSEGESKTITMSLILREDAIQKLLLYLKQLGHVTISLDGEVHLKIFSSTVKAPFSISFTLSASDLGVKP